MTDKILEAITFKLSNGITDEAFLRMAEQANVFLARQEGFIARRLAKGDDNVWQEHIEWESLDAAQRAFRVAEEDPSMTDFIAASDPQTISMAFRKLALAMN